MSRPPRPSAESRCTASTQDHPGLSNENRYQPDAGASYVHHKVECPSTLLRCPRSVVANSLGSGNRSFGAFQDRGARHVVVVGSRPPYQVGTGPALCKRRDITDREAGRYPVLLPAHGIEHEGERRGVRAVLGHQVQRLDGLPIEHGEPQPWILATAESPGIAAVFRRNPLPPLRPDPGLDRLAMLHGRSRTDVDGMSRRRRTLYRFRAEDVVVCVPVRVALEPSQDIAAAGCVRVGARQPRCDTWPPRSRETWLYRPGIEKPVGVTRSRRLATRGQPSGGRWRTSNRRRPVRPTGTRWWQPPPRTTLPAPGSHLRSFLRLRRTHLQPAWPAPGRHWRGAIPTSSGRSGRGPRSDCSAGPDTAVLSRRRKSHPIDWMRSASGSRCDHPRRYRSDRCPRSLPKSQTGMRRCPAPSRHTRRTRPGVRRTP